MKDWTPFERRHCHPILQFYAETAEAATEFFVAYYRALFRLELDEMDFTISPQ